ncbi:FkbM family methyltransferase [Methylobacillus sp. Pita1]|uniref:FkbM family methyltransferase n=1 Tax=Methylobacillus sp. Pita1 TaxID=3382642 RepID=UPI0038B58C7F
MALYDYENNDGSSHASIFKDVIEEIHHAKAVEHIVNMITLDEFVIKYKLNNISLLKIDTEGNELNVLMSALESIRKRKVNAMQFEFNEMNVAKLILEISGTY